MIALASTFRSEGWDSEMMEYAHVIQYHGTKYMFYNGNKFGHSGFGFAELSDQHRRMTQRPTRPLVISSWSKGNEKPKRKLSRARLCASEWILSWHPRMREMKDSHPIVITS